MDMTLILALVGIAVAAAGVWWYLQQQRSRKIREQFGPEYERVRSEVGDAKRAEAVLAARQHRAEQLHVRSLTADESASFSEVWRHVQTLFVDDPKGAIREADHLVNDVMSAKGYPMADFDQRAADISVGHAAVVEHYHAARDIARRNESGTASTEDLRQAVIHYRALFDDLLEQKPTEMKPVSTRR